MFWEEELGTINALYGHVWWTHTKGCSGGSRGGAWGPHLFLDQTEARRAEKFFFWDRPPLRLSHGLDDRPPLSEGLDPPLRCRMVSEWVVPRILSFEGVDYFGSIDPVVEKKNNLHEQNFEVYWKIRI